MTREFKVLVKKYDHGYVASALGFNGAVAGEGDTYEEALACFYRRSESAGIISRE